MRKALIAFGGLVVLLIAALLVGPSFFDWNNYKPQIASAVKDALGRELRVVGDINLSILPIPALSVRRVSLENVEGADNREMVAFDEVEVKIDVSSLLQGKIAVKSVRLVKPVISLEITKDGRASWDIKLPSAQQGADTAASTSGGGSGSSPFAVDVSLESLQIEDATISYVDARSGLREKIEDLSTTIAADSLQGPFRADGKATARGIPIGFSLAVGRIADGRPLPVRLALNLADGGGEVSFKGRLSALTPDATLSGAVKATSPNVAALARRAAGLSLPAVAARALELEAEVAASATTVDINKLAMRLGDMSFAGAVHGSLKPTIEADIVLSASKVDLDPLFATPSPAPSGDKGTASGKPGSGNAAETRLAKPAAAPQAGGFSLPADIAATFDLGIETATYKGGVIRNAVLRGVLRDGVLTLERAAASLPGSSEVSLGGRLEAVGALPQFTGDVAATSGNVRGLAQWLGVDPAVLPADRLRNFSYTSTVKATPKSAEIGNIAMQLDVSRFTGGMAVELREKPGVGLRLAVDKLNLDAYLPKPSASGAPAGAAKPEQGAAGPKPSVSRAPAGTPQATTAAAADATAAIRRVFDAVDANVELSAGQLSLRGETARTATANLTIFDKTLTIRELSVADFAGMGLSITGEVDVKGDAPALQLNYAVAVRDAARLARFAGAKLPVPAARLGKVASRGRVDATIDRLKLKTSLTAMGAKTGIDGTVASFLTSPKLDLAASLDHPELAALARAFAPDYRPAARKLGPLSAKLRLKGSPQSLQMQNIDVKAGPVAIKGTADVALGETKTRANLDLRTSEVLLDLFLPAPAAGSRQTGTGGTGGGRGAAGPRTGSRANEQRWSDAPVEIALPPEVDADVKVQMAALTKDKLSLKNPRLHAVLKSGRLALNSFTAEIFDGKISAKAAVEPRGKTTAVAAELTIDKLDSRTAVKTLVGHDRVQGPLSFRANLTTAGRSERSFVSALNGTASLSGQAQILLTRKERDQIGIVSTGGAILSTLLGGKIRELQNFAPITQLIASLDQAFGRNPARVSGDFRIRNGVAQTDNLALTGQGNTATTRATIDLPRWQLNSATALIDDPQQEPLVTFDASGPIDQPSRTKIGGRLIRQGSAAAQEKAASPLQRALPGLLGGGGSGSSGDQGEQKLNPGKLLEGIFKQLQR